MKPIVLLTHKTTDTGGPFGLNYGVQATYARAIALAGAVPLVTASNDPEEMIHIADGILFTGGIDVNPQFYGEENLHSNPPDPDLDRMELDLFHAFFEAGKPIFGICRGIQLVNVALGGSLYQDIPIQVGDPELTKFVPDGPSCHPMNAVKGSVVESLFGERFWVNTYHHQGIKEPGKGLRVTARNDEGIAEAIEHESHPLLAVQWHPERMIGDKPPELPDMTPLFQHFVSLCAGGARLR